jgi:hypothetical protein
MEIKKAIIQNLKIYKSHHLWFSNLLKTDCPTEKNKDQILQSIVNFMLKPSSKTKNIFQPLRTF